MNLPQVHEERLPQKSDVEFLLNERNVLQIMANKNDKIGIEGEFADISDIQNAVKSFTNIKMGHLINLNTLK